jgi:hypothetical protein
MNKKQLNLLIKETKNIIDELSYVFNSYPIPIYKIRERLEERDFSFKYVDFLDIMDNVIMEDEYEKVNCILLNE